MRASREDPGVAVDSDTEGTTGIDELSPSAKLVYKVLEHEGPMTQEGIARESRLCSRTVRYAIGKLGEHGIVSSQVSLEDARQSVYRIDE